MYNSFVNRLLIQSKSSIRSYSTKINNDAIKPIFTNRNPRNLELMRIGYKPDGYHLEKPGRCYWHKLELTTTGRHVTAIVRHFENGPVLQASTQEWGIKKQLYRNTDTSAYINIARVLAQRCLESGITEIASFIEVTKDGKVSAFLKEMENGGIKLKEPPQYKKPRPWDATRPEKPWETE